MQNGALKTARKYFELSNARELNDISELFTDTTIYFSENTGSFVGKTEIMEMMEEFFANFKKMSWLIESERELNNKTVQFNFKLTGVKHDGEVFNKKGVEFITVSNNKIERIEIHNI